MSDPEDPAGADASTPSSETRETTPDRDSTDGPADAGAPTGSTPATRDDEPDIEEILDAVDVGESRKLDPNVRYLWVVGSLFGAVVGGVLVAVAAEFLAGAFDLYSVDGTLPFGFTRLSLYLGGAAVLVFVVLAIARSILYYRSWRYEVRTDSLYLTRGVLTRVQTVAPYVRVQHIDTRRSPFERVLGLSSLVVYTAGSRGADVTIPGLTDERAAELQSHLKRLAIATEEEDAV